MNTDFGNAAQPAPVVKENDLDFSTAIAVRKKASILKSNTRLADSEELIETIVDGKLERSGTTKLGDYVVTGGKGEEYIIKSEKWPTLYEDNPLDTTSYRSKNHGRAITATSDLTIARNDGTTVTAKQGDALYFSEITKTVNVIDREIFAKDYQAESNKNAAIGLKSAPS